MTIPILFDDAVLLAINKPPGLSVHAAPGKGRSVLQELRAQISGTGWTESALAALHPVHRLDKDASGVLLCAKTKSAARALETAWNAGSVVKTYLALCDGIPEPQAGVIDAPILENQTGKPERLRRALAYFQKNNPGIPVPPLPAPKTSAVHPAGRASQTRYRVVENIPSMHAAWLEICPQQGRMHQIRVHLAHLGHPLLFDPLYNPDAPVFAGITRLPLHALRLEFPHPTRSEADGTPLRIAITAPLPDDLVL